MKLPLLQVHGPAFSLVALMHTQATLTYSWVHVVPAWQVLPGHGWSAAEQDAWPGPPQLPS